MGTSTSYSAPPSWGDLKATVTRAAGGGALAPGAARQIVRDYIDRNGGASGMARGSGGGGGRVGSSGAARAVAGRLGGFITDVGTYGLDEALRRAGLSELVSRPVREILAGLLDHLGGSSSTLDDVDARAALSRLQDELLGDAEDAAEVERILAGQAAQLELVLEMFFGFYLFEQFCRVFFERLVQRVGETRAHSFLSEIEGFLRSALVNRTVGRDLAGIDWTGSEGRTLVTDILESTLRVFGG